MADPTTNIAHHLLSVGVDEDVAIIDRDGTHTYRALRAATTALTSQILGWGLAPGSRVALLSRNSLFWVAAYLAIMRAGHVAVPFATTSTPSDVLRKSDFIGCCSLLLDSGLRARYLPVVEAMTHLADQEHMLAEVEPPDLRLPSVEADDDAALMFTSGTTSAPRAVRVSHGNIRANTDSITAYLGLVRTDRVLVVLPFSYCYGASLLHTHLRVGASLAICDSFAFPESAVEQIREHACTGLAGVPSTYQVLLRASSFARASLPSLRWMQQAGGRLPPSQVEAVAQAHPHAQLFVMYGATEATARMAYLPPAQRHERPGSIGRAIPGVSLVVVDEDGHEVPTGQVGEIFATGENITKGYWDDPQASAAKFVDGGLRTGDLAYADDDGYLYVVDRKDDFIKSWGVRVSTREVEDAIVALPGVASASVVGCPDADAGEAIHAFYVVVDGAAVTPAQVLAHCRATLARPLVPHEIHLLDEMPLNANGKIIKSTLRHWAEKGS